jgi:hypothetical protein
MKNGRNKFWIDLIMDYVGRDWGCGNGRGLYNMNPSAFGGAELRRDKRVKVRMGESLVGRF